MQETESKAEHAYQFSEDQRASRGMLSQQQSVKEVARDNSEASKLAGYVCPEGVDPICTRHGSFEFNRRHEVRPEWQDLRVMPYLRDPIFGEGIAS